MKGFRPWLRKVRYAFGYNFHILLAKSGSWLVAICAHIQYETLCHLMHMQYIHNKYLGMWECIFGKVMADNAYKKNIQKHL